MFLLLLGPYHFHPLLCPSLHNVWNVPLVSLIFLKRTLVFPILLFSSISLHWSLRKAFLSPLAILCNCPLKWVYLSFSPLHFTSLLFSAICKASSDNYFAICISVLGDDLDPCLLYNVMNLCPWFIRYSIRSNPLKPFVTSLVYSQGIWFRSCLNGLVVFPTFFNLSLNWAIKSSWSEPQSALNLIFADCRELLHLWLQRI